jgi:hypothetical protein
LDSFIVAMSRSIKWEEFRVTRFLFLIFACLVLNNLIALAGQSGYIFNGKVVITHKDGEPINKRVEEEQISKRGPAAIAKLPGLLYFDEDDLARCYWLTNQTSLYCIKK